MSDAVAAKLLDLGDLMERREWNQGAMYNVDTNGLCLMGGVNTVAFGNHYYTQSVTPADNHLVNAMLQALRAAIQRKGWKTTEIPRWNDWPGRKKQQVLDVIQDAAKFEMMEAQGISDE